MSESETLTLADVGVDGPWAVRDFGNGHFIATQDDGDRVVLMASRGAYGAKLVVRDRSGVLAPLTPDHPVARAIVALPDLLDAARDLIETTADPVRGAYNSEAMVARKRLVSAITKATGGDDA